MLLVLSSNISLSLEDIVCLFVDWRASRQWKGETVPSVHSLLMLVLFVPLIRLMLVCLTLPVSSCLQNALPTLLNRPCAHAFGWSFQHWLNPLPILFSVPVGSGQKERIDTGRFVGSLEVLFVLMNGTRILLMVLPFVCWILLVSYHFAGITSTDFSIC